MMGPYSTARIVDVCFCACVRTCCVPTTQSRQTPVYGRCKYGSSSLYYGGIRPHQERQGVWQHGSLSLRPLLALGRCQRVKLHSRTKSRESTRKASCRLNTIPVKCPAKYAGKLTAQFEFIKFEYECAFETSVIPFVSDSSVRSFTPSYCTVHYVLVLIRVPWTYPT